MGMFDKVKNSSVVSKAKELDEKNKERNREKAELKRIRLNEKERIKNGEEIIKRIMGTKMVRNTQFNIKIANQGISTFKTNSVWSNIHKQINKELREGTVELEDIPERIDQILIENGNPKKIQEKNEKINNELIKLGVENCDFSCTLHEQRMSTFGNKKEDVVNGYCYVNEDRIIIKKRSVFRKSDMGDKVIPYAKINAIDYDKAAGFHVTSSIVISVSGFNPVVMKNTTEENFRLLHDAWINFNSKSDAPTPTIIETNKPSDADELLKYAELFEKGLLTKEEFDMKKAELMGTSNTESQNNNAPKFCSNCGNPIDSESKFCSNCGNSIN